MAPLAGESVEGTGYGLTKDAELASPGFCGKGQVVPVGDGGPSMRIKDALVG